MERVIHLTAQGTRHCFNIGRQHKSNNVILTVDLVSGMAYQACYDKECVHHVTKTDGGAPAGPLGGTLKAMEGLDLTPANCLPDHMQLHLFEYQQNALKGLAPALAHVQDGLPMTLNWPPMLVD